jgi:hypothetical protein
MSGLSAAQLADLAFDVEVFIRDKQDEEVVACKTEVFEPRLCAGTPPLQSELAKWAQWAVAAEEWQSAVLGVPVQYHYNDRGVGGESLTSGVLDEPTIPVFSVPGPPVDGAECLTFAMDADDEEQALIGMYDADWSAAGAVRSGVPCGAGAVDDSAGGETCGSFAVVDSAEARNSLGCKIRTLIRRPSVSKIFPRSDATQFVPVVPAFSATRLAGDDEQAFILAKMKETVVDHRQGEDQKFHAVGRAPAPNDGAGVRGARRAKRQKKGFLVGACSGPAAPPSRPFP